MSGRAPSLRAVLRACVPCVLLVVVTRAYAQAEPTQDEPVPEGAVEATLGLGLGFTRRAIELPSMNGPRKLETAFVPAIELDLGARVHEDGLYLGAAIAYQSSVGAEGVQEPLDPSAAGLQTHVRSHRLEVGALPGLRFGSSPSSVTLGLFAGWALRTFDSVVELPLPRYTLHGPIARVELEVPLASGAIVLRAAPEAQLIVSLSRDLRSAGSVDGSGVALGAEIGLRIAVFAWAAAQLSYRESHASAGTAYETDFDDVERYALLDAVFRYF